MQQKEVKYVLSWGYKSPDNLVPYAIIDFPDTFAKVKAGERFHTLIEGIILASDFYRWKPPETDTTFRWNGAFDCVVYSTFHSADNAELDVPQPLPMLYISIHVCREFSE
jgi:hypothetical protein